MEVEEASQAIEHEHHEMRAFAGAEPQGSFMSTVSTVSCKISYSKSAKVYLYLFLIITCVPLIAGGAFTSIFIEDRNTYAAISAFFAAAISCGTLSIFIMHLLGKVEKFHDMATLNGLKVLGMIVSVASGVLLGMYTILAFLNKQEFDLEGENYFSAAVFSGLCLATSLELYIVAQWYQNALQKNKSVTTHIVPGMSRSN